jgi:hypothetical protein
VKMTLIVGPALTLTCTGCGHTGAGGTEDYTVASTGETRAPECWYHELVPSMNIEAIMLQIDTPPYCAECSAKLVEQDPTRSVSQFYSDVTGAEIRPEILQDL